MENPQKLTLKIRKLCVFQFVLHIEVTQIRVNCRIPDSLCVLKIIQKLNRRNSIFIVYGNT